MSETEQSDLFGDAGPPYFFNTTHELPPRIAELIDKASGQERDILAVFVAAHDHLLTPWDVQTRLAYRAPITSVRRAMTNLTTRGALTKTGTKRASGPYRHHSYCWRLAL